MVRIRFLFFGALCILLSPVALRAQQFTFTNHQLVSSVRVSLYQYDYTYQITAANTGPDADTVTCVVTSTTTQTIVESGNLAFGNMASGSTAVSTSTLVLRQDRRYAFSWSNLQWQWSSTVPLPPFQVQAQYNQAATVTSTIDSSGGAISVATPTGQATLIIPPNALLDSTEISMTPITALTGAPLNGITWLAGVQLQPEGLQFFKPVTLTFLLASTPNPATTAAFVFRDDGTHFYQDTAMVSGNVARMQLMHFTDAGVSTFNCSNPLPVNPAWTPQELALQQTNYAIYCVSDPTILKTKITTAMTNWFNNSIWPEIQNVSDLNSLTAATGDFLRWYSLYEDTLRELFIGDQPELDSLEDQGRAGLLKAFTSIQGKVVQGCSCTADPTKKPQLQAQLIKLQKMIDSLGWPEFDTLVLTEAERLCQQLTGLGLQKPSVSLQVGQTVRTATVFDGAQIPPGATVQWTSSDSTIATWDPVSIYGVGQGFTNLTVSASQCGGPTFSATLSVQVNPRTTPCQTISALPLLQSSLTLGVGQSVNVNQVFDSSQLPPGTTVQWTSQYPEVAGVDSGMIVARWQGFTTLTVTANSQCGQPASATITVQVNRVQTPGAFYTLIWSAGMWQDQTSNAYAGNQGYVTYHYATNATWSGIATFDDTGICLSVSTEGSADIVNDIANNGLNNFSAINIETIYNVTGPGRLQNVLEILEIYHDGQGPYMYDPLFFTISGGGWAGVNTSYVQTITGIQSGPQGGQTNTQTNSGNSQSFPFAYVGPEVLRSDFATGQIFSKDYESTDETTGITTFWKVAIIKQKQP